METLVAQYFLSVEKILFVVACKFHYLLVGGGGQPLRMCSVEILVQVEDLKWNWNKGLYSAGVRCTELLITHLEKGVVFLGP